MKFGKMIFEVDLNNKEFDKKMEALQKRAEAKQKKIEQIQQKIADSEARMKEYETANEIYWKQYEEIMAKQAYPDEVSLKTTSKGQAPFIMDALNKKDIPFELMGKAIEEGREFKEVLDEIGYSADAEELVDYDEVIERLNKEFKKMVNTDYDKLTKEFTTQKQKLEEEETQLRNILNDMEKITEEQKKQNRMSLKDAIGLNDLPKANNIIKSMTGSIKKLSLGIIGASSAYRIISKASSAYLQIDEHTTKQMQANWTALGTLMGNTIKYISTAIKKLVTGVLHFASVLTGVNYIEKANTAILKSQTKATKDLTNANNKLTASFDEMEILNDTSSELDTSDIDTSVLFDINDLGEGAIVTIEKIGNALKPVYETLKSIIDYAEEHPDIIALALGGYGLTKLLASIIGSVGTATAAGATGLAGVLSILGYIAGIGTIAIAITITYLTIKEAQQETQNLIDKLDKLKMARQKLNESRKETILSGDATEEDVQRFISQIFQENDALLRNNETIRRNREEMGWWDEIIYNLTGEWSSDTKEIENNYEAMKDNLEIYELMYEQGLLNDEQLNSYSRQLYNFSEYLERATDETGKYSGELTYNKDTLKDAKEQLEKTKKKMEELSGQSKINADEFKKATDKVNDYNKALGNVKTDVKTKFNIDLDGAKRSLNNLFSGLSTKLSTHLGINFPTIKLARGGIVNNPGKGVSLGSNIIGGEAGPEAVLPLNEETMGAIAQLIADKMVINLTNVNQMNGRVISRELQKVQNENNFAYNK